MVKLFIDFIQFLYTLAPLFLALGVLTLLAVLLSKSIKRHATVYYIVFAIPFALVAIPFVGRLLGIEVFNFGRIPFLGGILRDYIHAGTLGFPLLIIIMYTGALNPQNPIVKRLLSIRKELSILSGFPILTHSLIRVTNSVPGALRFFIDGEASERVTNSLGAGISNFSFLLGVLMLALFLPLWVTSFDFVHKRMGGVRWKKWQKWSYVLYATLFIHAMCIQVGGMLNPRGGRETPEPTVEVTATTADAPDRSHRENPGLQGGRAERGERGDRSAVQPTSDSDSDGNRTEEARPEGRGGRGNRDAVQPATGNPPEAARPAGRGGHQPSVGFADITVGRQTKQYIHIASLLLIFGSYVYFRLRKAKQDAAKRLTN
jgi:DMSO/TMAO reductase YedYZ heme-binding membrane subunit